MGQLSYRPTEDTIGRRKGTLTARTPMLFTTLAIANLQARAETAHEFSFQQLRIPSYSFGMIAET